MITGAQCRAARALLRWSGSEAAKRSGLTLSTIERIERHEGIPPTRSHTQLALQKAFEAEGIEFVGRPGEGPGVRRWEQGDQQ